MTNEQEFLINVLADCINHRSTINPANISWEKLRQISQQQQVSAIVYSQTKNPLFQSIFAQQVYYAKNQEMLVSIIRDKLDEAKLPYFFVKGVDIKKFYPHPELRSMGDADLVVNEKDKIQAGDVLNKLGFKKIIETNEWVYIKNQFEVELHHALAYEKDQFQGADLLNNFWPYVKDNELDINYHLIYMLFHLRRHLLSEGAGFRQFMDIAVVCNDVELNLEWIKEYLKQIELYDFASTVFAVNERWFDVKAPFKRSVDVDFFNKITEKIFKDGVFGYLNEDNVKASAVVFDMQTNNRTKGIARFRYLISQVFPNYVTMCHLPYCTYVKSSKLLLPISWIHRGLYRLFSKKQRDEFLNRTVKASAVVDERLRIMKQWGL